MKMKQVIIAATALTTLIISALSILSASVNAADKGNALKLDLSHTALLITDPQNDFLSPDGAAYGLVADNLKTVGTIQNIERLFKAAKSSGVPIFVSPHHYFPHDDDWQHRGALQQTMHDIGMFKRTSPLNSKGFQKSGADFLEDYKPYILDGKTVISSPHRIYGPDSSDLVLMLRKHGIDTVLIGGMAANLCTDSHMRELVEQGFKVVMISDAVGAPGQQAYDAALLNYGMIANAVWSTDQAVARLD